MLWEQTQSPEDLWGWLWYSVLWATNYLLWAQESAIQIFLIGIFFLSIVAMILSLGIRLKPPKIKIDIAEEEKNNNKSKNNKQNSKKEKKEDTPSLWEKMTSSSNNKDKTPANNSQEQTTQKSKANQNNLETPQDDKSITKSLLKDKFEKKLEEKTQEKQTKTQSQEIKFPEDKPTFDINLLQQPWNSEDYEIEDSYLVEKAEWIKDKLNEFGIPVSIEWFNIWPTVIQIKIIPEGWIKISKIENLKKDISLALKTKSLRVIAPIPGTEYVGIEIPNPKPQIVTLSEIISSNEFSKLISKNTTNLAVWKNIEWKKTIYSLEKMPHLLVAWATGSGKSVWINTFILSLIYQNTPDELKFIMIDPKQVELWIYDGIPYLLSPIITEPEKSTKVLKWIVDFMNERYNKLKKLKVRNIDQYNKKVLKEEKMYRLVIIVDELADLMMSGDKKSVENYIARIAQMARAVGIHLIVATQRPSVNVITWLIKANIPTRIAFGVVSRQDSRTILDVKWAEDLVGKWDMLYMDPNTKFPVRLQSPFVDTDETEKIVSSIKEKYMQGISENDIYHPEIINILEDNPEKWEAGNSWDDDELVEEAIKIIQETRKASATMLQRKLGVWFARAAKIMDILEERWVVGPADWAKPRDIYV